MKNKYARNFVLGLIAGSVALLVAAAFRLVAGGLFIPELASQTLFSLTPGQVESFSVETFGSLAKYAAFTTAVIVNLVLYGGLAILLHKTYIKLSNKGVIVNLIQLSFIPYLMMVAISAFLLQLNELLTGSSEIQYALLFLLLPSVAYGLTLSYLFQRGTTIPKRVEPRKASNADIEGGGGKNPELTADSRIRRISRRQFIAMAATTIGVAIFIFWARSFPFHSKPSMPVSSPKVPLPPSSASIPAGSIFAEEALTPFVASELTPNDKFYRIDTNIIVPSIDANTWRLNVKGLVRNGPLHLNASATRLTVILLALHIGREFH
jgi:hypothetical protein